MKTWIYTCTILLVCLIAAGQPSNPPKTYHVMVSTDGNTIKFNHADGNGFLGHQIANEKDTIIWVCDKASGKFGCDSLAVQFKKDTPCTANSVTTQVTCVIYDSISHLFFGYNIAVTYKGATVLTDPEVIVDNAGDFEFLIRRRAGAKKK